MPQMCILVITSHHARNKPHINPHQTSLPTSHSSYSSSVLFLLYCVLILPHYSPFHLSLSFLTPPPHYSSLLHFPFPIPPSSSPPFPFFPPFAQPHSDLIPPTLISPFPSLPFSLITNSFISRTIHYHHIPPFTFLLYL